MTKRLINNLISWSVYTLVSLIPVFLVFGSSLKTIGVSMILGFFAGMFNDILRRLIEIRDILKYSISDDEKDLSFEDLEDL